MEGENQPAEDESQSNFFKGALAKFGLDMKMGLIIAIVVVVIFYFGYTWVYPTYIKSEGVTGKKENKKDAKKEKSDTEEEISDLVEKIETKQSKNMNKK